MRYPEEIVKSHYPNSFLHHDKKLGYYVIGAGEGAKETVLGFSSESEYEAWHTVCLKRLFIPTVGDTIVVWFSRGAASAVAAKKTIELYGEMCTIRIVTTSIKEEDEDNIRFENNIESWLGIPIEYAIHKDYPKSSCVEVWEERKFMSNRFGAVCTKTLKKEARYQWEENNHHDFLVMGFTSDEKHRHERFSLTERNNILPILIDNNISKDDCYDILIEAGIRLPLMYMLGFPNANCIGCVKACSATYWNHVRKHYPEVFNERAEQSRRIGAKLVWYKKRRIFLDELPIDAKGRALKSMKMPECSIFCEEKQ